MTRHVQDRPAPPDEREAVRVALAHALFFLEARDRMNAEVHLSDVRWSPLTVEVRNALIVLMRPKP